MLKKISTKLERIFDDNTYDLHQIQDKNENSSIKETGIVEDIGLLENLGYVFSYEVNLSNLSQFVNRISLFFEAGFLLKRKEDNLYTCYEAFYYCEPIRNSSAIRLPNSHICSILKTDAQSVLKKMNLGLLDKKKLMNAYLIRFSADYALIVVSQSAEPWAQLKIKKLQEVFLKINFSV